MRTILYDSIDSTNDEARRLLSAGRIDGVACIRAREQTAGRGTRGRSWDSPRDAGVYLTVVRRIRQPVALDPQQITPVLGTACATSLCELTGAPVALRGVNDLYVGDGKLGGLLTEVLVNGGRAAAVLVGVGVNLYAGRVQLSKADLTHPIALEDITSTPLGGADKIADIAVALADAVDAALVHWIGDEPSDAQA